VPGCEVRFQFRNGQVLLEKVESDATLQRQRILAAIQDVAGSATANRDLRTADMLCMTRLRIQRSDLPWEAAHLAGQAFLQYHRQGGTRTSPLPDYWRTCPNGGSAAARSSSHVPATSTDSPPSPSIPSSLSLRPLPHPAPSYPDSKSGSEDNYPDSGGCPHRVTPENPLKRASSPASCRFT